MKFCELVEEYLKRQEEIDSIVGEMKKDAAKIKVDTETICKELMGYLEQCRLRLQFLAAYKKVLEKKTEEESKNPHHIGLW